MDEEGDGLYARPPEVADVARVCRALHERGARYVLIGGFAVISHGLVRTTKDLDLLVDPAFENVARVRAALGVLADNAAAELADDDVSRYGVVRVADEIVVDLLGQACGVTWQEARQDAVETDIGGTLVPVASPSTLIRTKQTIRPSDAADVAFLRTLLR